MTMLERSGLEMPKLMVLNSALSSWERLGWVEIGRFMAYFPLSHTKKSIINDEKIKQFFTIHDIDSLDDPKLKFLVIGSQISILLDLRLRRSQIHPSCNTKATSKKHHPYRR